MKTLVLLSGGLDSAVVLAMLLDAKIDCSAIGYLDVPMELTWSCYLPTPTGEPCGQCLACTTKADAMKAVTAHAN